MAVKRPQGEQGKNPLVQRTSQFDASVFGLWRRALEVLDVDPSEVLALGDGENDVEMMELIRNLSDFMHSGLLPGKKKRCLNTA